MSERTRLTTATLVTSLLLAAITVAGIALHVSSPPPAAQLQAAATAPAGASAALPTPTWHDDHD